MSETIDTDDLIQATAQALNGDVTTARRERLQDLFAETDDPDPITLYEEWHGETPKGRQEVASASAGRLADESDTGDFDPETDNAHNRSRVRVRSAYNDALDAGMTEAAEYLRNIAHTQQIQFARLLQANYLEGDLQERAREYEPPEREATRLKEF